MCGRMVREGGYLITIRYGRCYEGVWSRDCSSLVQVCMVPGCLLPDVCRRLLNYVRLAFNFKIDAS